MTAVVSDVRPVSVDEEVSGSVVAGEPLVIGQRLEAAGGMVCWYLGQRPGGDAAVLFGREVQVLASETALTYLRCAEVLPEVVSAALMYGFDRHADQEQWKARFTEAACERATDEGYCSDFDDFMEDWGLTSRRRDYQVELTVTLAVTIGVTARSEDDAMEMVDSSGAQQAIANGNWDFTGYTVDGTTEN